MKGGPIMTELKISKFGKLSEVLKMGHRAIYDNKSLVLMGKKYPITEDSDGMRIIVVEEGGIFKEYPGNKRMTSFTSEESNASYIISSKKT
tara:strand:- start:8709 stop:8981 length:273 start_codon:yes stop_codon:yes gene_type:complete